MDLICKLFGLLDLSASPESFGFIGTQLRIINFQVIPEYMNRDVVKLFTRKSTVPNSYTGSRLAKLFAIEPEEKMQLVSTVSSKLLQNNMINKLEEAYLFVKELIKSLGDLTSDLKFTHKQYFDRVKANIEKLDHLVLNKD